MDRSEFEGLVAQTMHKLPNASLSPKQQFQSQIRGLAGRPGHQQVQLESNAALVPRRHELHHVSTLRVQQKRNASAPPSRGRAALTETSHNLNRCQTAALADHTATDFNVEEREGWSKKSAVTASTSTRPRQRHTVHSPSRQQAVQLHQPRVFPPPDRLEPIPQPRKQVIKPSLRQFEPLATEGDFERPKTSRGLHPKALERTQTPTKKWEPEADRNNASDADAALKVNHRSKFLEGSMNDRSVAVASSWYNDNTSGSESFDEAITSPIHDTDTDCGATPRASKQPLPTPTSPAAKKGIFRFGGGRSSEDSAGTVEIPKNAKECKGLRKSISIWNFREKLFGSSGSDAASETSSETVSEKRGGRKKEKTASSLTELEVLNERKRKADAAYAQQFGVKKQKSNLGLSVAATSAGVAASQPTCDGKRPKTPTLLRRKRNQHAPSEQKRGAEALDTLKRLSRRDLEKENQQLRNMLRQSQSMTFSRSASPSPTDPQPKESDPLVRAPVVMLSPGRRRGRRGEDIPPVPKLPDQSILAEMQHRNRLGRAGQEPEMESHGSFETIEEGEEGAQTGRKDSQVNIPEHWEWPEDVF